MKSVLWTAIAMAAVILIAGCSGPKLTEKGKMVRVMEKADDSLNDCTKFTPFRTKNKTPVKEKAKKYRLVTARNNAGDAGANVIVPISEPDEDGWQTFDAYRCK